jgi:nicotinate-nucleotide pyrophosphorylase (carboxylating)
LRAWKGAEPADWWRIVEEALAEDLGPGDVSAVVLPPDLFIRWSIEAQQSAVVCGAGIVEYLLASGQENPEDHRQETVVEILLPDGSSVNRGDRIAQGVGLARRVLSVERTALNFLMLLSGVSTLTREYVQKAEGTGAKIVDTRKTIPGLRSLQKYAVRCGGGFNHRMGLYDGAMLKDNHIHAARSIVEAIKSFRNSASHMTKLEVECENSEQVDMAVESGAEIIMLDNMDPFEMRQVVKKHHGKCLFEASGGITLDTVRQVALTGVDLVSVGALTHSAPAAAFHMEFE